jgi:mono/diheme cytochrome c family protein
MVLRGLVAPEVKKIEFHFNWRTLHPLDQDQWLKSQRGHCFEQKRNPSRGGPRGEGEHRMGAVFRLVLVMGAAVASLPFLGLSSAIAADADHGADLAKRWCATCHVVASDQKQASADVPPFATIAHKSGFTPEKVAYFLLDPHPKMPNFPLSRDEAADIAAYIDSLRK